MLTRSKSVNAFIKKIRSELANYGIKLTITKSKYYLNYKRPDGGTSYCCGIFIPPEENPAGIGRIFIAARGRSLAETVLSISHEYIHWRQWLNNEKIWYSSDYYKLERNTERRAISFMKKNGLPKKLIIKASKVSSIYLSELKSGAL
jgi:hypothetical protein